MKVKSEWVIDLLAYAIILLFLYWLYIEGMAYIKHWAVYKLRQF